jgi:formiminotetrahydrofolate cyclodeaminase
LSSEQTIQTFLDELASAAPTPGGGGAAAFNGAMAAALISMVCNLTIGREKFIEVEAQIKQILSQAEELRAKLTQMIAEDAAAVEVWLAAYRLPKANNEERTARQAAIQAGAKKVTLPPLTTAQACAEVIQLGRSVVKIGNPNLVGDAQAAIICAEAGLKIAAMNILLNLKLISDEDFVAARRAELEQTLAAYPNLAAEVYQLL